MKDLTMEKKAELAVKMAIFDAIEKAQENKNDNFELMQLKVKTFLKTPTFQKNAEEYLELINNHEF